MKNRPYCRDCQNWTLTRPDIKVGVCSFLGLQTEWCAGIRWKARRKYAYCDGFVRRNTTHT